MGGHRPPHLPSLLFNFAPPAENPLDPRCACGRAGPDAAATPICGRCPEGLVQNGERCVDIDECTAFGHLPGGGCHVTTACANTFGGWECAGDCPPFYNQSRTPPTEYRRPTNLVWLR